jgi:hypothetical protein
LRPTNCAEQYGVSLLANGQRLLGQWLTIGIVACSADSGVFQLRDKTEILQQAFQYAKRSDDYFLSDAITGQYCNFCTHIKLTGLRLPQPG